MLFNEQVPQSQFEIDPTYLPEDKKWLAAILGFKNTGERNTWGKITRFLPGAGPVGNNLARQMMPGTGSDFEQNVQENLEGDWQGTKAGLNLAVGAAGAFSGNPQMIQAGGKGLMTSIPGALKEGADLSNDWTTKYFAYGGMIGDPPGLPPELDPTKISPWLRHRDPTWEEVQRMNYMNKMASRNSTVAPAMMAPVVPKGIMTNNPDNISTNNLNTILPELSQWMMPQRKMDPMVTGGLKKGGRMSNGMSGGMSDEDIAMFDKWTGKKIGEASYGERIMDKDASQIMTDLAAKKKYTELGKYVAAELKTQNDGGEMEWKKGGKLSPSKARMILKDGKIRGKPITEKQRRYFWAIANEEERYQGGGGLHPWTGGAGPMSYPEDRPPGIGEQLGGWEQLFNLGQFATGMLGANDPLPEFKKPDAWTKYLLDSYQRAKYGMSNAERALYDATQGLTAGLNFARETSGGNSSFAIGDASRFAGDYMGNAMKMAAMNEQVKSNAIDKYGNNLLQDISMDKDAFAQKYQEAMMKKTAAAKLAQMGLQSSIDQIDYNKNYGPGSLNQQYLKSQIDLVRKLTGLDWTGWTRSIVGDTNKMIGSETGGVPDIPPFAPPNPWGVEGQETDLATQYNPWLQ